jgi:sulfate adenylyltransferase
MQAVFTTDEMDHPGVRWSGQADVNLAGTVEVWSEGSFGELPWRVYARKRPGGSSAKAVSSPQQLRNPMHRSHEYLCKIAIEICDGVLIHPPGQTETRRHPRKYG